MEYSSILGRNFEVYDANAECELKNRSHGYGRQCVLV